MQKAIRYCLFIAIILSFANAHAAGKAEHVVVLVWDGMRPDFISPEHTPTLYQMAQDGVMFQNHHPVYCSSTEVNGTALATGCYPGHSGIIANSMYRPDIEPRGPIGTESVNAIRAGDAVTSGHYLARPTVVETLREAGKRTAIAGSKGVVLLHDRKEWTNTTSSSVTLYAGTTLPAKTLDDITDKLGAFPPSVNDQSTKPNSQRDDWTTQALLGTLWATNVPDYSLLWLSEPDWSQHATGPGSARSLLAVESSDRQLAAVLKELDRRGIRDKTDVFVVSDHGFSTVKTAVDVAEALRTNGFSALRQFKATPKKDDVLVAGQGGSVLFYVIGHEEKVIHRLVEFLQQQEFSGVIFAAKEIEGTFTLSQANIDCPNPPDVVLSLRWSSEKSTTGAPGMFYSDGGRKPGGGNHASLSHFDMHNTLVGAGPDLKKGFVDTLPTANTDIAPTVLWLLGVKQRVAMDGRVLGEAMAVDAPLPGKPETRRLEAIHKGKNFTWQQYLQISQVNDTIYLDEGNCGEK